MVESGRQETVHASADPEPAAGVESQTEEYTIEPLEYFRSVSDLSINTEQDPEKHVYSDEKQIHSDEKQVRPEARRALTTSTSISTTTAETKDKTNSRTRSWSDHLNPLKRRKLPPVPKERIVSREYGASFLSLLTFQWMAPLMSVG